MSRKTVAFPSGTVTSDINNSLTNDTLVFNGGATVDLFNPETVKSINVSGPTSSNYDTINLSSNLTVKEGMQFINGEMLIHDSGASANLTLDGDSHLVSGTDLSMDKMTLNGNLFLTGQAFLQTGTPPDPGLDAGPVTGHGTIDIGGGSVAILGHVDPKIRIKFDTNGGSVSMIGADGNTISGFANFFQIALQSTVATQELFDKHSGKYELTDSSGSVVASLVFKDLDGVTPTAHQSGGTVFITTDLTGVLPITYTHLS
jgi:hypothetical protein